MLTMDEKLSLMDIRWAIASSGKDYTDWADFVRLSPNANFLHNEHRNVSYESYGFKTQLIIGKKEDTIVAGSFIIIIDRFFLLAVVSSGGVLASPLILEKFSFLDVFDSFSRFLFSSNLSSYNFFMSVMPQEDVKSLKKLKFQIGKPIGVLPSYTRPNLVKLLFSKEGSSDQEFQDKLLQSFTKKGRRDVRASMRHGLSFHILECDEQIKEAYGLIEKNAARAGYSVRSWKVFGQYILKGVQNSNAYVAVAKHQDEIVGAILLERGGATMNYSMGAATRLSPDLQTGYYLQYHSMIFAQSIGLQFYNIGASGPQSVQSFKANFNPKVDQLMVDMYISRGVVGFILTKLLLNKFIKKSISITKAFVKR